MEEFSEDSFAGLEGGGGPFLIKVPHRAINIVVEVCPFVVGEL
jgi:hypothetical protein